MRCRRWLHLTRGFSVGWVVNVRTRTKGYLDCGVRDITITPSSLSLVATVNGGLTIISCGSSELFLIAEGCRSSTCTAYWAPAFCKRKSLTIRIISRPQNRPHHERQRCSMDLAGRGLFKSIRCGRPSLWILR